jgi:Fe-S cluster biogenesis protein NfuA/nitrite reductase/ring-hydroxylating ferredoxin subunit
MAQARIDAQEDQPLTVEPDLRSVSDQIENHLTQLAGHADRQVVERTEELVGLLMRFYGAGLTRVLEIVTDDGAREPELLNRLGDDELVSSLLILHGIHPLDVETRVERAIDKVRPYLGSHGGDVELVSVDGEVARLRMQGTCSTCPASQVTLDLALEKAILEAAPELSRVEAEAVEVPAPAPAAAPAAPLIQLQPLGSREGSPPTASAGLHGNGDVHANGGARANGVSHANGSATAVPSGPGEWLEVSGALSFSAAMLAGVELGGTAVLVCRSDGQLYAYRDACPSCGSPLQAGRLDDQVLSCPRCSHRFDVRLAGRSLEGGGLHLDPLPLIAAADSIRIAVPAAR